MILWFIIKDESIKTQNKVDTLFYLLYPQLLDIFISTVEMSVHTDLKQTEALLSF